MVRFRGWHFSRVENEFHPPINKSTMDLITFRYLKYSFEIVKRFIWTHTNVLSLSRRNYLNNMYFSCAARWTIFFYFYHRRASVCLRPLWYRMGRTVILYVFDNGELWGADSSVHVMHATHDNTWCTPYTRYYLYDMITCIYFFAGE